MRRRAFIAGGVVVALVTAFAVRPIAAAIRIASAATSQTLCNSTFIQGREPDNAFRDELADETGMNLVRWALSYRVDRARREVSTRIAGGFASRAVYHDGWGCRLVHGREDPMLPAPPWGTASSVLPEIAGPDLVEAADPQLRAAIDRAFEENPARPARRTKAVVVVHDGRVVGEQYAAGYSPATPLWGHSMTKSVLSALVGILVRDGRLRIDGPAPVAWPAPDERRRAITVDELLRMTSGLALDERGLPIDAALRMWFLEDDMESFALRQVIDAPPGTRWAYSNAGYQIISRIFRDVAGGNGSDALRFARRELFEPLGMHSVVLEFDATGTPVGARDMFASARDWARFGMLYLHQGQIGGRQILPNGWTTYSASRTLATGYGAGFWTSLVGGNVPVWGVPWSLPGVPGDAFLARGARGQYVIIVPSQRLVVVRMGASPHGGDAEGVGRLVVEVIAALKI